jgi:hypothetical protein
MKIVEEMRRSGTTVSDEDLAHVWPLARGHVAPYGVYRFTPPSAAS